MEGRGGWGKWVGGWHEEHGSGVLKVVPAAIGVARRWSWERVRVWSGFRGPGLEHVPIGMVVVWGGEVGIVVCCGTLWGRGLL